MSDPLFIFKRWAVLLENICITQVISEFSSSRYFDLVPNMTMFIFLLVCKYGLWMVHLCLHSMGCPPPPLLYFFFLFQRWLFGNGFVSVWWWAAQAPGSGLAINSVCAGKASTAHEGRFLSTAEDSNNR